MMFPWMAFGIDIIFLFSSSFDIKIEGFKFYILGRNYDREYTKLFFFLFSFLSIVQNSNVIALYFFHEKTVCGSA